MIGRAETERRIAALMDKLDPAVRKAFAEAIRAHIGSIDVAELERLIEAQRFSEAVTMLRVQQAFVFLLAEALRAAYIAGGSLTGAALPAVIRAKFGFGTNPRAEQWARNMSGFLIQRVDSNLEAVQGLIATAANDGVPNARVALDITGRVDPLTGRRSGGLLGLNAAQTEYVNGAYDRVTGKLIRSGARQELARLDPHYLTRELRDKRFDPTFRRAMRDGNPLTAKQIDQMAGKYSDRLLAARGKVIARTETLNALRAGQREGWLQAMESGAVRGDMIERTWLSTSDGRTRPDHVTMNGQFHRGMNEPFTFPDGSQAMFPGDISLGASAKETVQCRCVETYRLRRPENGG